MHIYVWSYIEVIMMVLYVDPICNVYIYIYIHSLLCLYFGTIKLNNYEWVEIYALYIFACAHKL